MTELELVEAGASVTVADLPQIPDGEQVAHLALLIIGNSLVVERTAFLASVFVTRRWFHHQPSVGDSPEAIAMREARTHPLLVVNPHDENPAELIRARELATSATRLSHEFLDQRKVAGCGDAVVGFAVAAENAPALVAA